MDLYIPYGWTPYEGERHYGVFSSREKAQNALEEEKKNNYYENYDIYVLLLDEPETF
jgi:hypothetical protein